MKPGPARAAGLPFPMPDYIAAWKVYRAQSDEDNRMAAHVASYINATSTGPATILDVGPGDGRVILKTLIHLLHRPRAVICLEPNPEFASETRSRLGFYKFGDEIAIIEGPLGDYIGGLKLVPDYVLCTHSIYFLSEVEFSGLLDLVRRGAKLIVVLDHEHSLFTELWKLTAPEYYDVVNKYMKRLRSLDRADFNTTESYIEAELTDPFFLRDEMRNLILSLLCYTDVTEALEAEAVLPIIKRRSIKGRIKCMSSCFEIDRVSR